LLNDGSCVRVRPQERNYGWSYDFLNARTSDGLPLRFLTVLDEYTRKCLAISVARKLTSEDVLDRLADLFVSRGIPAHIRSDNGPEFTAGEGPGELSRLGVKTLYIKPGRPRENGYIESFKRKIQEEFLNRELLDTLLKAWVLTARWQREYNNLRPNSALHYRPPAPKAFEPWSWTAPLNPSVAEAV
jgi:transposase InsO family protein